MSNRFPESRTNIEAIQRYIEAGGEGVELTDKQQQKFDRLRHMDELIRQAYFGKYQRREDLVKIQMEKFSISRDTAFKDVVDAELVFSSSAPLNKKYFIQRRIEMICDIIARLTKRSETDDDYIDADNSEIAARWEAVLQKYVSAYPDYIPTRSPKNIVYVIQNNLIVTNLTPEQAIQEADIIIRELENDGSAG